MVRWRCCPTNCMHSVSINSNADRISPSIPLQVLNVCRTSANPGQPAMGHRASGATEGRAVGRRASPIARPGHPLLRSNITQLTWTTSRVTVKVSVLQETLHSSAHKFVSRSPDLKLCLNCYRALRMAKGIRETHPGKVCKHAARAKSHQNWAISLTHQY